MNRKKENILKSGRFWAAITAIIFNLLVIVAKELGWSISDENLSALAEAVTVIVSVYILGRSWRNAPTS